MNPHVMLFGSGQRLQQNYPDIILGCHLKLERQKRTLENVVVPAVSSCSATKHILKNTNWTIYVVLYALKICARSFKYKLHIPEDN